jgi:hypothetical protein
MKIIDASGNLGCFSTTLDKKGLFEYSDTIDARPTGLVNNDGVNGPLCWEFNQLSTAQQFSFQRWFYIGGNIDMSIFPNTFYYVEGYKKWVYRC